MEFTAFSSINKDKLFGNFRTGHLVDFKLVWSVSHFVFLLQDGPLKPIIIPSMNICQSSDISQPSLHSSSVGVDPLKTVHVSIQNLANLHHGIVGVDISVVRVEMFNDLSKILRHPLELSVKILCELICSLSLTVHRSSSCHVSLERFKSFL